MTLASCTRTVDFDGLRYAKPFAPVTASATDGGNGSATWPGFGTSHAPLALANCTTARPSGSIRPESSNVLMRPTVRYERELISFLGVKRMDCHLSIQPMRGESSGTLFDGVATKGAPRHEPGLPSLGRVAILGPSLCGQLYRNTSRVFEAYLS